MDDIRIALDQQHAELEGLIGACTDGDWERPTRCEGWDVACVLLHLAQTDEFALASATGDLTSFGRGAFGSRDQTALSVDDAVAVDVANDRAAGGEAIRQRWREASTSMRAAFAVGDPHQRVPWVSGLLSLQTLVTTRLAESWIHTGDIASALEVDVQPTDRLRHIARLAWRTLPYAFERGGVTMHGPVALDLVGPNGDPWQFHPEAASATIIHGSAVEFCEVAARRVDPSATSLVGEGPDVGAVLSLVRTYAQ